MWSLEMLLILFVNDLLKSLTILENFVYLQHNFDHKFNVKNKMKRDFISLLLYIIILLVYIAVNDFPALFILLAWLAGYFKEYYD